MAPRLRTRSRDGLDPQRFRLWGCFLLAIGLLFTVGVAEDPFRSSFELRSEKTATHGRRLLAVNLTRSVVEDGEALLLIKAAITADPSNATYWWKRQGTRNTLNPCRMRNSTASYWPGINCTGRRVSSINLANMSLAGTLSPYLGALAFLESVDLSSNLFTGPIPVELTSAAGLVALNLGNNRLDSALPIGNWTNLTSLDVSNNRLEGEISISIGDLQNLKTLNMSNNNLTGAIPAELNLCTRLNRVDLSTNRLQGTVPFQNLSDLTVLHLQENQLTGDFVSHLDTLPGLEDLDLSNNYLSGSIPTTISSLPLRTQLSLGRNNLTGSIPNTIGELSLLLKMNLSANALIGMLPNNICSCVSLQELDLSANNLTGRLPGKPFATLANLVVFNVSQNEFEGDLPMFADLKNLKVLDASYNNLEGPIPDHFADFDALTYLNVSYNMLVGEMPYFTEHDDVNVRSFVHNHLCGPMLNRTCERSEPDDHHSNIISIAVGSAVAFVLLCMVTFCCCSRYLRQGKEQKKFVTVSSELELKISPEEILRATQNFDEQSKIGEGSMSNVYRGVLADNTSVAVKKLAIRIINEGTEKVFAEAFEILSHIRHWSLVKVLGYCCSTDVTALVMEYMPNGNLNDVMYPQRKDTEVVKEFSWHHRFNAAIGVAEGLTYLHHECPTPTVHGDLKPSNILFNTFMEARITDFAVAKILGDQGVKGREAGGPNGYKAPESVNLEDCTIKGDVYTFGIVLLEMISGRSPQSLDAGVSLPDWIRSTLTDSKVLENILDPVLRNELEFYQQKMSMVLGVALLCTREQPQERPYMTDILKMLNHIKTRPHDDTKGSMRFKSSPSTHQRNEEIRHEVPGIEITPSPPTTPGTPPTPPHTLTVQNGLHTLPHTPSLSAWTPSPENR